MENLCNLPMSTKIVVENDVTIMLKVLFYSPFSKYFEDTTVAFPFEAP